jgi:hypothetical protein
MRGCEVPRCDKLHLAKGLCARHYKRWRRHGHPGGGRADTPRATTSPTTAELHWAAGFLEGDGFFGGRFGNHEGGAGQGVTATQCYKDPLFRLQRLFGGTIGEQTRRNPGANHNRAWVWRVYGARARGVMMTLYPMLSPRRQKQVREAL